MRHADVEETMRTIGAVRAAEPPELPWETAAFAQLLVDVRAERDEFERLGYVPPAMIEKLKGVGIYRAMTAKRFGGDELSPADFLHMVEAIATADASTGWVASFGVSATYLAALPIETLRTIYADDPDLVFAGSPFPPQLATRVPDGLKINGRWKFGSGSMGASLIGVGITLADDSQGGPKLPRMALLPRDQVTIEPNWDVIGLIATGSHDLVVHDAVVSEDWTFIRGGKPSLDTPLYRYPPLGLAAQVLAVVALGVARAALDELAGRASGPKSITGAAKLIDRPYVHLELAKAEAILRSARAFFYETTEAVWATLLRGDPVTLEQATMVRLAASHAAHSGAKATRMAYTLSGTAGIFNDHPISRYLRDAMVVPQHAFLNEGTYETAGRVMLTGETQVGFP
jgi:alkylation response protein AidB-like acyl-CoA dehydrogenase